MSERTQEAIKQIHEGVVNIFNSDNYKNYLKFHSQFHSYSIDNQILIYLQNPASTAVAGYKKWQELGRQVRKGEKGIKILAPYIKKVENDDGTTTKQVKTFFITSVFDVSQTDGEPVPTIVGKEPIGQLMGYDKMLRAVKAISRCPIEFVDDLNGASGVYSHTEDVIKILSGQSEIQKFTTAIHELAHSRLHKDAKSKSRNDKECEAESIAYIVANHFGIDTSDFTFGYVASWAQGRKSDELLGILKGIQNEADNIIIELEDNLDIIL